MTQQKPAQRQEKAKTRVEPSPAEPSTRVPKPESSSEYEGASSREPTGNPGEEVKTETSSTSGE